MKQEKVPFSIPFIDEEDKKAALEALGSRWLTGGPKTAEFENLFASYIGTEYAISVSSGTAALHLSIRALDIGPGDEVIVPVLTFAATANAPLYCGARPVFVDVDRKTFNIAIEEVQEKITSKTKAIIPVHYGGQPCDMKEMIDIAEDHKLLLVEDCAHSPGAKYKNRQTGSFGKTGCFSFYPTKNLTTLEGGMITTNDEKIAKKIILLRGHAMSKTAYEREKEAFWYYDVTDLGYNYRMDDVRAALGITRLKKLNSMNKLRRKNAHYMTKNLSKIVGIIPPYEAKDRYHIYHLYVIRVVENDFGISRNELFQSLSQMGIGLSVHYTPLHLLSFYRERLGYKQGDFPVAEELYNQLLSLPMFPQLTKSQMNYVIQEVKRHYTR